MKHILVLIFCLGVAIMGFCQTETLLVNETFDNVSIEKVFKVLKKRYDLKVAYDYQDVAGITVSKHLEGETLESALGLIFSNTGLEYQLKNNRLLIRSMPSEISSTTLLKKKYDFKGTILDGQTNKPLEFATVSIIGEDKGTDTDSKGQFRLSLSTHKKSGQLVIQYLGYLPQTIDWTAKSNLRKINIVLQPKPLDFEEVTITDRLPTIGGEQENGAILLNATKLNTLPSFVGGSDMFRSIQLLPGVSADDDLSAELRIRGGNGDENMVILDGITLYKVDHYFGVFSAINSSLVDQVNVYKNAFPVEYGGRTSGVVEFSTNEIERPKIGGGVEVNLLTSNAYLELPLASNMNVLLGGRITNKNVADTKLFSLLNQNMRTPTNSYNNNSPNNNNNPPFPTPNTVSRNSILAYEPDFSFYDFNVKWTWNILPTTRLTASYFQGYDEFNYDYTQLFTVGANGRRQTSNEETYEESGNWRNKGWSLQAQHTWAENLQTNFTASYSGYEEDQTINTSLVSGELRRDPRTDSISIIPRTLDTINRVNNNYNEVYGLDLNFKNEWHISDQQEMTFGYNFIQNEVAYDLGVDEQPILAASPIAEQHALYAQYRLKLLSDKVQIGVGLRATNYSLHEKFYYSPRLMFSYQAAKSFRLKASWSQYNQFLRRAYYEDRFGRSYEFYAMADKKDFPVSKSKNWMTGFNYRNDFFEIDVELYQKNTTGILEYALTEIGIDPERNNIIPEYELYSGNRVTKGIDVLLKKTTKQYAGWIAYTLSETTNSFEQIRRGEPYPSRDDRRHQLKFVNQYRYKQFDLSATYIYSSGKPYTDFSQFTENLADRRETDLLNSYLESYQRIDVGLNYRFKWGKTEGKIGLSIFNLLNRKNVKYRQFVLSVRDLENTGNGPNRSLNTVLGTELQMLDRTPNISMSLKF